MTRVAGVSDNFSGLPLTQPGIEVLDGRRLGPSDVLGRMHYPMQCLAVRGRAVAIPGSDATRQGALDGAAEKPFEDLRTHAKSFRSPEGEWVLLCPLHDCLGVLGPCQFVDDVDAKELSTWSTTAMSMRMGACSLLLFLQSSNISFVEGEVVVLALHCQVSDVLHIGCLIVVSDQAYHC